MKQIERRVVALEQAKAPTSSAPPTWVSVQTEAEAAAVARRGVKVYVGVSPDDWDEEHEAGGQAAESA